MVPKLSGRELRTLLSFNVNISRVFKISHEMVKKAFNFSKEEAFTFRRRLQVSVSRIFGPSPA
jgi:hypothetical protein